MFDIEQRSDEWFALRAGKITGSRMADVMATKKTAEAADRYNYRAELVCETLTGLPYQSGFSTPAMERGTLLEDDARAAYEGRTLRTVKKMGLIMHPTISRIAASPDGLVDDDGCIEIKIPNTNTHLETLMTGVVPSKYRYQMWTVMVCAGRSWCDFVSYDPRFPPEYQLIIYRFHRDDKEIILMEASAKQFLSELDATLAQLPKCQTVKL
jgi:putative phage-type endonuclease